VRRCPVRAGVIALYSDSKIAINWVKQGQCRSLLRKKEPDLELRRIVEKAELRLKDYGISFQLLKWKTEDWGEIPADFGRK
jgi:ribonuclease HI